jgi:hypothetical protein
MSMSQKEKENIAIHQKGQRTFSSSYFSSPRWEINKKAPEPVLRFLRNQSITKTKEELYISFRRRRRETTSRIKWIYPSYTFAPPPSSPDVFILLLLLLLKSISRIFLPD